MTSVRPADLGPRVALVVGNSQYTAHPIASAENDTNTVAATLRQCGFRVKVARDLGTRGIADVIEGLAVRMPANGLVLFYFTGHGMQIDGASYLVPVENDFSELRPEEIKARCVCLDDIAMRLLDGYGGRKPRLLVMLIDACRSAPMGNAEMDNSTAIAFAPGLASLRIPPEGVVSDWAWLFSAPPGRTLEDPAEAPGPFTAALLSMLGQPVELETLLRRVAARGAHPVGERRRPPWSTSPLIHDYYLSPADGVWLSPRLDLTNRRHSFPVNPYLGLEAFQETHAAWFFGREAEIEHFLGRLRQLQENPGLPRLLWLVGASGAGKSSFTYAGILPRLRAGAIGDSRDWLYLGVHPGPDPMAILADQLSDILAADPVSLRRDLDNFTDPASLSRTIVQALARSGKTGCLLLIDPFEGLLAQTPEPLRTNFITQLQGATARPGPRIYAIATLRTDRVDELLERHRELTASYQAGQEFLAPMPPGALRAAIEKPAKAADLRIEAGLPEQILNDSVAAPGALPLIQFALYRLVMAAANRKDDLLRHSAYHDFNGLRALEHQAERVYTGLANDHQRGLLRAALLRMVAAPPFSDLGRHIELTELWTGTADDASLKSALQAFLRGGLLHAERDPLTGQVFIALAHEVLMRHWRRLNGWIREAGDALTAAQGPENSAPPSRSHRAATSPAGKRLPWFLAATATVVGLCAVAWSLQAVKQPRNPQSAALASQILAAIRNLKAEQNPDLELTALLGAEALRLDAPSPLADELLRDDLLTLPRRHFAIPRISDRPTVEFSPDNRFLLIHDYHVDPTAEITPARLYDLASGELIKAMTYSGDTRQGGDRPSSSPIFCPDAACLYWLDGSTLMKLDLNSRQATPAGPQQVAGFGAWSRDGKHLMLHGSDHALRVLATADGTESLRIEQPAYREGAFGADGQSLWVLSGEGRGLRRLDLTDGHEISRLTGNESADGIGADPAGSLLWTYRRLPDSLQRTLTLWDPETARPVKMPYSIGDAAVAPGGSHAILWPAASANAGGGHGELWDLQHTRPLAAKGIADGPGQFAFGSDGGYLLGCGAAGPMIWDLNQSRQIAVNTRSPSAKCLRVALNSESSRAAVSFDNGRVDVLKTETGATIQTITADGPPDRLTFAAHGQLLLAQRHWSSVVDAASGKRLTATPAAAASLDRRSNLSPDLAFLFDSGIRDFAGRGGYVSEAHTVWRVASRAEIAYFRHAALDGGFSEDGQRYWAGSTRGGIVLDLPTGRTGRFEIAHRETMGLSLDGTLARMLVREDDHVALKEVDSGRVLFTYSFTATPNAEIMSHDGRFVVVADANDVRVFASTSGKEIFSFAHDGIPEQLAVSRSGSFLLMGNAAGNRYTIWNLNNGQKTGSFVLGTGKYRADISEDERLLAATPLGGLSSQMLEFPSGRLLHRIGQDAAAAKPDSAGAAIQFLRGSKFLMNSMGADGVTRIWDTATGAEIYRWAGQWAGIGADGDTALSFDDHAVHRWSLDTGKEISVLRPEGSGSSAAVHIGAAALSPDGRYISLAVGTTVHVFDAASGQEISRVGTSGEPGRKPVDYVGFGADGRHLAVRAGRDHWISLWRPDDMLEETCQRVSRNLTRAEWQRYLGDTPYHRTCSELPEPFADGGGS